MRLCWRYAGIRAIVNTVMGRKEEFKSLENDIKEKQNEFQQYMQMVTVEGLY